jgi:hypothetical protein
MLVITKRRGLGSACLNIYMSLVKQRLLRERELINKQLEEIIPDRGGGGGGGLDRNSSSHTTSMGKAATAELDATILEEIHEFRNSYLKSGHFDAG